MTTDPLGLARCERCGNAIPYDTDARATAAWRAAGHAGFICHWCADTVLDVLGTDDEGADEEEPGFNEEDYPRD